tara:strand:- start:7969 stop:8511 length:543 start_codon:yes stop_codon:yes gene_type:complete
MWLKSLQKKHVWKMKHISKETGLPEASLASWFKAGSIAPEKYWTRIGQFLRSKGLEYSSERVIELYTLQRREFGFLVDCEECGTEFLRWAKTKIVCNSLSCQRALSERRKMEKKTGTGRYRKIDFSVARKSQCPDHSIDHSYIDDKMKEFLSKGGKIEKLESPEIGALRIIEDEMMKAGF